MKTRLLSLALLACWIGAADAATITVNSSADPSGFNPNITIAQLGATVTLRDAVNAANNTAGNDDIVVAPTLTGQTITLSQVGLDASGNRSSLNITGTMTIAGPAGGVTIRRDPTVSMRLFWVSANGNLTLNGLTVTNGNYTTGSAIQNLGVLSVLSSTLTNCAASGARGGAIFNAGTLTVMGSTFSSNNASSTGGAIYNSIGATFTVTNTSFNSNQAFTAGGAIATADTSGSSTVAGCTFTGNNIFGSTGVDANDGTGGGAIRNTGVLAVSTCTFTSNTCATHDSRSYNGGAISNSGTLNLNGNTFVGNAANASVTTGYGGALENVGQMTATNCTFTSNNATAATAILSASGSTTTLNYCTIVAQQTPASNGIAAAAVQLQGTSTITNTIICRNYWHNNSNNTTNPFNVSGSFNGNNNLIDNDNPGVDNLGSNGGPTQTMALLSNSVAIDAGVATAGVTTDQRGVARPQGGGVDIGAFEFGVSAPSFASANAANFFIGTTNRFQVAALGLPTPTVSASGALPTGVSITTSGLLSGTPSPGTAGTYPITLTAMNSSGQVTQQFTLTVSQTDLIVTTTADEDDGSIDPGLGTGTSMREAFNAAINRGGSQTIIFSPALAGQTIGSNYGANNGDGPTAYTVTSNTNLTVQGLAGDQGVTLARTTANDLRGFIVYNGGLTLTDLTLANWTTSAVTHSVSVRLSRCTVRNTVNSFAAIGSVNFSDAYLENCTIVNNSGYAVSCNGFDTLRNCTVTGNNGGLNVANNGCTLLNTILAGNTAGGNSEYPHSFFRSGSGNNIFGTGTISNVSSAGSGNIIGVTVDQLHLAPLADNGGPTQTMALLGGPAVNAAAAVSVTGITTDQRGMLRSAYNAPDIGAYEFSGTTTPSLVVTTTADELDFTSDPSIGTGTSLREALAYANSFGGAHTITFAPALTGQTITLSRGELMLTGNITIDGTAAAGLTISGGNITRIMRVAPNGSAVVNSLALANGNSSATSGGGAIYHNGASLTLQYSTVRDSQAINGAYGGAISANSGSLSVIGCTFSNNHSTSGNGGAIVNLGTQLTITNSTFSGNSAFHGGAFVSYANTTTLTHCTVVNNSATYTGGGVERVGRSGNAVSLQNTLVAGNAAGQAGPDTYSYNDVNNGAFTTLGHNLIGNGDGNIGLTNGVNADQVGTGAAPLNAAVGPLQNNGGPTLTVALLGGSPAIDAAATVSGLTIDQRGVSRPQGNAPDIGAFETIPAPVVTLNPQDQMLPVGATATFNALASYLFGGSAPNTASNGATLLPNQYLLSPNHAYQLLYQNDGNLVLYRGDGLALWGSGTAGQTPGHVSMQADGNLVIYGPGGTPQYATGTNGNPNAILVLQNDGNLVIYTTGSVPIFATNTASASLNAVPTVQWQVSTNHGMTFTDIPGATGVTLSFIVAVTNQDNRYRAVFSNGSGVAVPTAPATLTVQMTLPDWRTLQGLAANGSQDLANPSGDGISNLLKFAFNLAPNAGDLLTPNYHILAANGTAGLPFITRDSQGHLVITFVRRKAGTNPGIAYTVETGSELTNFTPLNLAGASVVSIDSTWERVTVIDPATTSSRFGRVRVAVTP